MTFKPCPKCGKEQFYLKRQTMQTGLYCSNCHRWIKWLGIEEIRAYEFQQNQDEEQEQAKDSQIENYELQDIIELVSEMGKVVNKLKEKLHI